MHALLPLGCNEWIALTKKLIQKKDNNKHSSIQESWNVHSEDKNKVGKRIKEVQWIYAITSKEQMSTACAFEAKIR